MIKPEFYSLLPSFFVEKLIYIKEGILNSSYFNLTYTHENDGRPNV